METNMNPLGIYNNLNRERIRKLLTIGLFASILTGIGDFLLGYAAEEPAVNLAASIMASAPNLSNGQMIAGSLLGFFGIFLEGLSYFAVYRLMADAAPGYAHSFRTCIFGYIWLAPVGCHLNMGILNMAYKYLLQADPVLAAEAAKPLIYAFSIPVYILLILFWVPMIVIQFQAFNKELTPYPRSAKWFCMIIGMLPALLISLLIGPKTALGAGIGTMFISIGNAFVFGGLLVTLPPEEHFKAFRAKIDAQKSK